MSSQELNVHARRWGVIGASLLLHRQLIENSRNATESDRKLRSKVY